MGLNSTVSADRIHISFFGCRNAGKSSLVNALTGQPVSVVSEVAGTTTDPVNKTMELLPLGPVLITDTAGFDDQGPLGEKRVAATRRMLAKTDIGVLVVDSSKGFSDRDLEMVRLFKEKELPYIVALTKADISGGGRADGLTDCIDGRQADGSADRPDSGQERGSADCPDGKRPAEPLKNRVCGKSASSTGELLQEPGECILVSAVSGQGIEALKEKLGTFASKPESEKKLLDGFAKAGDTVVLVTPIDESAPKGRLILPQQQVLRALLEEGCTALLCQPEQLGRTIAGLKKSPDLVITDSQAFGQTAEILPRDIPLTSFSIIFAKYKGDLKMFLQGAEAIKKLADGDTVLISEGCTHHRQCNDIGTVKLPNRLRNYSGVEPDFVFTSGGDFPEDLGDYKLVIHCGGCMLNTAEMKHRMEAAAKSGTPIVNYGIAIALLTGVPDRVTT